MRGPFIIEFRAEFSSIEGTFNNHEPTLYGLLGFSLGVYRVHDIVLLVTMMMIFIATSVRTFITATSSTITAAITSITASYEFYHYYCYASIHSCDYY